MAEMMKAAMYSGPALRCRATFDEDILRVRLNAISPAIIDTTALNAALEVYLNSAFRAPPESALTTNYDDVLQRMLVGQIERRNKPRPRPAAQGQQLVSVRDVPMQALLRGQPMPAGAH
jgi:hypothetical protein